MLTAWAARLSRVVWTLAQSVAFRVCTDWPSSRDDWGKLNWSQLYTLRDWAKAVGVKDECIVRQRGIIKWREVRICLCDSRAFLFSGKQGLWHGREDSQADRGYNSDISLTKSPVFRLPMPLIRAQRHCPEQGDLQRGPGSNWGV